MSLRRRPKMDRRIASESSIHNPHDLINIKIQTIFPEEIVTEILSRLPVKILLKFRCVSKSWCSLISSKHFAKFHLANSRKDTKFTHHRIVSTVLIPYYTLKSCSFHSLLHEPTIHAVDFDYPMKHPSNAVRLVGCCNGLVCIAVNGKKVFLWNPSTKEHKRLPGVDEKIEKYMSITTYGFGYDERNDDYKVVGIFSGFSSAWIIETMVKVYSLKTNSWNRIEVFKDGFLFDDTGKFVSGKLHWGRRNGFNSKWDIVYVDLNSEICGTVEQPTYTYTEGGFSRSLGVLGDCLCVLCDFPKLSLDVWVMKQYGVEESWDKIVTIFYNDLCDPYEYLYSIPLFIGPKGEVVLVCESSFVVYDIGKRSFKRLKTVNFEPVFEADVYVESLVSLVP